MTKNLILGLLYARWAQIRAAKFFFKNLTSSVTRHHGQLSSCIILGKANDPILRKVSDGRKDGQTEESDFLGRSTTNVVSNMNNLENVYIILKQF